MTDSILVRGLRGHSALQIVLPAYTLVPLLRSTSCVYGNARAHAQSCALNGHVERQWPVLKPGFWVGPERNSSAKNRCSALSQRIHTSASGFSNPALCVGAGSRRFSRMRATARRRARAR